MAVPAGSKNQMAGIFQYLLQIEGTDAEVRAAQAKLAQLTPETAAVYQVLNILPEGGLKSWLMANPVQFWKKIIALFKGKKYTNGDYVLGERLIDQIYCQGDVTRQQVSDDTVSVAHSIFNQLFGVRLATSDDLDALDHGVLAYQSREASRGISIDAIERAVYLKQHYFPSATYNKQCWDLRYFEAFPLVDRIPDYQPNKWYTGEVLGGAYAVDGLIPLSATSILKQFPGSDFDPNTGDTTTPEGEVIHPGDTLTTGNDNPLDKIISLVKDQPLIAVGLAVAVGLVVDEIEND